MHGTGRQVPKNDLLSLLRDFAPSRETDRLPQHDILFPAGAAGGIADGISADRSSPNLSQEGARADPLASSAAALGLKTLPQSDQFLTVIQLPQLPVSFQTPFATEQLA